MFFFRTGLELNPGEASAACYIFKFRVELQGVTDTIKLQRRHRNTIRLNTSNNNTYIRNKQKSSETSVLVGGLVRRKFSRRFGDRDRCR